MHEPWNSAPGGREPKISLSPTLLNTSRHVVAAAVEPGQRYPEPPNVSFLFFVS